MTKFAYHLVFIAGRNGIQRFQAVAAANDWKVANVEYFVPIGNVTEIDFTRSLLNIKNKGRLQSIRLTHLELFICNYTYKCYN